MRQFKDLSTFERDAVINAPEGELYKLAAKLDVHYDSLRARRHELRKAMRNNTRTTIQEPQLPKNVITVKDKPLHLDSANCLILNDLHAPYHNREMLTRALMLTQRDYPHIKDVCVGGDLFNLDRISRWGNDAPSSSLTQDLKKGREIVKELARIFDRVWVITGNHDQRFGRKLDAVITMEDLLGIDAPAKVYCSDYEYMYIGADWLLVHPRKYNMVPARTGAELCMLEQKNVITAHSHIVGMSQSKCGKFQAIDSGHLTDPEMHFYHKSGMTTFTKWSAGFVILDSGYAYQFTERFTDWNKLGL